MGERALLEFLESKKSTFPDIVTTLEKLQGTLPTAEHQSKYRLLLVMYKIMEDNDLMLLKGVVEKLSPPDPVTAKLTFTLDMPQLHLGFLFGKGGTHIKAVCKQYNVKVQVKLEREMSFHPATVMVTIEGEQVEKLDTVKDQLVRKAAQIVARRERHGAAVSRLKWLIKFCMHCGV